MKLKLYFIQEILNNSQPHDCVGELFIFTKEDVFNKKFSSLETNEYKDYESFTQEIEIDNG